MNHDQAVHWIQQVNGRLYYTPRRSDNSDAWVAVVPAPASSAMSGKLIIASGDTVEEVAIAAEEQWQTLWKDLSTLH